MIKRLAKYILKKYLKQLKTDYENLQNARVVEVIRIPTKNEKWLHSTVCLWSRMVSNVLEVASYSSWNRHLTKSELAGLVKMSEVPVGTPLKVPKEEQPEEPVVEDITPVETIEEVAPIKEIVPIKEPRKKKAKSQQKLDFSGF